MKCLENTQVDKMTSLHQKEKLRIEAWKERRKKIDKAIQQVQDEYRKRCDEIEAMK